ncbi:MAG: hypothetical protein IPJ75_19825 [Ignavibacteriales bacterium]|nr:hypothetical protein [Ignavibacteriales bacterium]
MPSLCPVWTSQRCPVYLLKNDNASASDPVEVELEFTENNKEYIVKRTLKGVAVTSKVALFRINDQILSPLAQNATDVAKELYKIIKLDKDSFVNSFLPEKANAGLLASKPAERVIEIRRCSVSTGLIQSAKSC